ncbi:MAG: DUF2891 domain-containing protein [Sphingomonadaceae bacterium]|nr:DUF2891 domain-containing protein [Sphingomonadaceae bacterium]
MIEADLAARLARIALGHVTREYPAKLDHVLARPGDVASPRALHPAFYGSFDWHSCVHGWWLLLTVLRLHPNLIEAEEIALLAGRVLTDEAIAGEVAYLDRPESAGFERPYGWAWALALHHEAQRHADRPWGGTLYALAHAFAERLREYLPKLTYPIRVGIHTNTAFSLTLSLSWAEANAPDLADMIRLRSIEWFETDRDAPAWEPGGDEFLSATLCEAVLMSRVLEPARFGPWFAGFLPRAVLGEPETLFTPAIVSDREDGKIAHLDGLNLSRAWAWRALTDHLPTDLRPRARATAQAHEASALPHLTDSYAGEHWLATYALMAALGSEC